MAIAEQQVEADPNRAIVIVGSEAWHKGIVGLVASRLVERFRRPACVLAGDNRTANRETAPVRCARLLVSILARRRALLGPLKDRHQGRRTCDGGRPHRQARETCRARATLSAEMIDAASGARTAAALEIDAALVMASGATADVRRICWTAPAPTAKATCSRVLCFQPIGRNSPRSSAMPTSAPCSKVATADGSKPSLSGPPAANRLATYFWALAGCRFTSPATYVATPGGARKDRTADRRRGRSAQGRIGRHFAGKRHSRRPYLSQSRVRMRGLPRCPKADYTVAALSGAAAPFVYRLGREIFILERGVRFP